MSKAIGIDLGTTFSVLAIKGKIETVAGWPDGEYLADCDVTIIPEPDGDRTFASVLWWTPGPAPDSDGEFLFGIDAKMKAEEEGEGSPIMFSKRAIGTTQKLECNGRVFTAKEVATHFLGHLKKCAERALGEPVTRAVITHPAYFESNQVQETREAAIDAGFVMSKDIQMMMEPAAAAYVYTLNDNRNPLRILAYDLGGGTFDVTCVERSEGVVRMKSFDGDHLLGGYNFDSALVEWMFGQMAEQNREPLCVWVKNQEEQKKQIAPEQKAAGNAQLARIFQYAENVKIKLADARSDQVKIPVKIDWLTDASGRRIQYVDRISRQEFNALIAPLLTTTVERCHAALDKAGWKSHDVDVMLFVGGSTYGPWVTKRTEGLVNECSEPYHPDLCVAAGAAMVAASELGIGIDCGGLKLSMDVPFQTPLFSFTAAGTVAPTEGNGMSGEEIARLLITLDVPSDTMTANPNGAGAFRFEAVPLDEDIAPGEKTTYTLRVANEAGALLLTQDFSVLFEPEGSSEPPGGVLPKSVFVQTARGPVIIGREGEVLPLKPDTIKVRMLFDSSDMSLDILQEGDVIGEVLVENIPPEAGKGSEVQIDVEITQNNVMKGTVRIVTRSGTLAKEAPVRITFPPIPVPDLCDLKAKFKELEERRAQEIILCEAPERRLMLTGKANKTAQRMQQEFDKVVPDPLIIARDLREFEQLLDPPADDMTPTRQVFLQKLDRAREFLALKQDGDPEKAAYRTLLNGIESKGNDAHAAKNHRDWLAENSSLDNVLMKLDSAPPPPPPRDDAVAEPTSVLKEAGRAETDNDKAKLNNLRDICKKRGDRTDFWLSKCYECEDQINSMRTAIDAIDDDVESQQALAQIRAILHGTGQQVKRQLTLIERGAEVDL